jgi:hypothetical protein
LRGSLARATRRVPDLLDTLGEEFARVKTLLATELSTTN